MTKPLACRWLNVSTWAPFLLGSALAFAVVAPWVLSSGWVILLDWAQGPREPLDHIAHGLGSTTASLPVDSAIAVLRFVFGARTVSWMVPALALLFAVVGAARLVDDFHIAGPAAQATSGAFYACNPLVFERLGAGQIYFLLGMAVLPWCVRSAIRVTKRGVREAPAAALWIAVATGISVHFFWLSCVAMLSAALCDRMRNLIGMGLALGGAVAISAYLVVPQLSGGVGTGIRLGLPDLVPYRTTGDPALGLYVNVLGLYGFWRRGAVLLPKHYLAGWVLILAAVLIFSVVGTCSAWARGDRRTVLSLWTMGAFGYLLALGDQGPIGPLFKLLYMHIPGFQVMREPQKFLALTALTYAVFLGVGIEHAVGRARRAQSLQVAGGLTLVVLYTPTIFWALGGQLSTSRYPSSWYRANQLMGDGPGQILVLPWHQYMEFPFTGSHVVANVAPNFFDREVISGDNVEVGPVRTDSTAQRSRYIEELLRAGDRITRFGHLTSQLGVRYIVLSKGADYRSYSWLNQQSDLRLVYNSPDIEVWLNASALPSGSRVRDLVRMRDLEDYLRLGEQEDIRGLAPVQSRTTPTAVVPALPEGGVSRKNATTYVVESGPPGFVVLPESSEENWTLSGHGDIPLLNGLLALPVGRRAVQVTFSGWSPMRTGYEISGAAVLLGGGAAALNLLRRRPPRPSASEFLHEGEACDGVLVSDYLPSEDQISE